MLRYRRNNIPGKIVHALYKTAIPEMTISISVFYADIINKMSGDERMNVVSMNFQSLLLYIAGIYKIICT